MHAFAFGVIGLMPGEYYSLLPHEFKSMYEGYLQKQYNVSCERRYGAFVSILPHTKDMNYKKFCSQIWPLAMDEQPPPQKKKVIEPAQIDESLWQLLKKQMGQKTDYERIYEKHKT